MYFHISCDDNCKLWVDGQAVSVPWINDGWSDPINLAGGYRPFVLEYIEGFGKRVSAAFVLTEGLNFLWVWILFQGGNSLFVEMECVASDITCLPGNESTHRLVCHFLPGHQDFNSTTQLKCQTISSSPTSQLWQWLPIRLLSCSSSTWVRITRELGLANHGFRTSAGNSLLLHLLL